MLQCIVLIALFGMAAFRLVLQPRKPWGRSCAIWCEGIRQLLGVYPPREIRRAAGVMLWQAAPHPDGIFVDFGYMVKLGLFMLALCGLRQAVSAPASRAPCPPGLLDIASAPAAAVAAAFSCGR